MRTTSARWQNPRACGPGAFLRAVGLSITIITCLPSSAFADQGYATWYGPGFQGNTMANGQVYDMYDPTTTASNIFRFGTWVQVTNPANGRSVVVQVRDRGAFSYALDLSYAAFRLIANPAIMGIPIRYQVVSGPSGGPVASRPAPPRPRVYVVQAGDTLLGIAAQEGVSADQLASTNGISDPTQIQIGQSLTMPTGDHASARQLYVVQPGDTISGIAQTFAVSQDSVIAANQLSDPNIIRQGQALTIPGL